VRKVEDDFYDQHVEAWTNTRNTKGDREQLDICIELEGVDDDLSTAIELAEGVIDATNKGFV
jgi:hypothetical protein